MAFIVEDGTNVENANAYVDLTYADNYFNEKMVSAWNEFTDDQKQARIIVATQYIEGRFRNRFKGNEVFEEQSLAFPRDYWQREIMSQITDEKEIQYFLPKLLLQATCEYAICVDEETMSLTTTIETSGGTSKLKRKKEEVGVIKTEYEYLDDEIVSDDVLFTHYVLADTLLSQLLKASNLTKCIRN